MRYEQRRPDMSEPARLSGSEPAACRVSASPSPPPPPPPPPQLTHLFSLS